MELLDAEYPGLFRWMGEVNLVKQALFANGRGPVPEAAVDGWAGFMEVLRERGIPLAIHSDLGSDDEPTRYLPLMEEVLRRYPENPIVWVHMGLSRELTGMDPARHAALMATMLERHPNLMLDITWRVIDDAYFSTPEGRAAYVPFLNAHSERILPGTDFLASSDKDLEVYRDGAGGHEPHPRPSRRRGLPQHRPWVGTTSGCWAWTTRRLGSAPSPREPPGDGRSRRSRHRPVALPGRSPADVCQ